MREVDDIHELRQNVVAFRDGWHSDPEVMAQLRLFRIGSYWLFDESAGAFANAKFAGYKGMTVKKYARARGGQYEGYFTGGVNKRIARIVGQHWRHDPDLVARLTRFAIRLAGADALEGVSTSKWQFLVLSSDSDHAPGTPPQRTRPALQMSSSDPELDVDLVGTEGGKKLVTHLRTERDPTLVAKIKRKWSAKDAHLSCIVCGFSFLATYGELGRGFIEAHHRELLSNRGKSGASTEDDFEPVCANCHRMLHVRGIGVMDTGRLREIVKDARGVRQ